MAVIAWIVESTWPACVAATARYAAPGAEIVLLHVTDRDVEEVAHGAYAGLLGRGHPGHDPGARVEELAASAGRRLLEAAAAQLGRPCRQVARRGPVEAEVLAAAAGAELLVLARDGDRPGAQSIGHTSRYVIDHAPCPVLLVWAGEAQSQGFS